MNGACVVAVCTAAVRNCLECRHRYSRSPSEPPSPGGSASGAVGGKAVNGVDPIQSLIGGSHPSTKVRMRSGCTQKVRPLWPAVL